MRKLYTAVIIFLFSVFAIPPAASAQCTDSAYFNVNVPYCFGTAAVFTNLSTGATTGYSWNFGDPGSGGSNVSALANPTHSFSSTGTFNVCLIAMYANAACNDTFCKNIVIVNPPVASFTFSPVNQCSNVPVQFQSTSTGTGLTYSWNFGDPASGANNTSTLANPQHLFAAYGGATSSYTVTLTVTNAGGGCTSTIANTVNVMQRPDASLSDAITNFNNCSQATAGDPSFTITVTNTSTTNAINTNYTITWGDGTASYNSATFNNTTHTYANLGVYMLTFIVSGTNGCSDTTTYKVLNISNPSIGFSSPGSTAGCGPKTYCFAITSFQQNDPTTVYNINFGDGSPIVVFPHPPPDSICHTYTTSSCGQPGNQFTAEITAIDACDSTSSTVNNIKIFTPPVTGFQVQFDTAGCTTQAFTFINTSTGGFNNLCSNTTQYTWTFGDGSPNVVTNSTGTQSHTYTNPGFYWVTLSSANYCSPGVVDSQEVCVNAPPVPGFILSDSIGCAPLTINVNNTTVTNNTCGVTSYTWTVTFNSSTCNPAAGTWAYAAGSNANSVNPTFIFSDPGSYKVSMNVNNKCIANLSQNITVQDSPNVIVSALANFCGSANINPSANFNDCYGTISSYSWSFVGGMPVSSASQVPGNVIFTAPGNYTVTASAANQCGPKSDSVSFIVHPLPTIITAAAPDTICAGQSSALSVSGAKNYIWSPATGLSAVTGSSVTATPLVTTTYICIGTDTFGCMDTDSVAINVNPNLTITVNPLTSTLCSGDSVQLIASGANIYTWFPATGLSSDTGATVYAHPVSTTVYLVKDSSFAGCPAIGTDTVKINPLPTITVFPKNPVICPVGSVNITASGAVSYIWLPAAGLLATTGATVIASPSVTTTYTVTGTDAKGCTNTDTVTVTVNVTIPISAGSDTVICIGSNIKLTATGGVSYLWSPDIALSCDNCVSPIANPSSTITYIVKGTDNNGCTGTDSVTVNVSSTLMVNAGPDQMICPGSSLPLNVTAPGAISYQWTPATGLSCTQCANPLATPLVNTTYIVSASDGVCNGADTIAITLYPAPVANAGPDAIICIGGDTLMNPSGGISYSWSPPSGLSCTACQNPSASPSVTTVYTVTVTDGNGCTATDDVTINVLDSLLVNAGTGQIICAGTSAQLNVVAPGAIAYTWAPAMGLNCTTCTNPVADPTTTTTYTVTATNSACTGTDTVSVNIVSIPVANAGPDVLICAGSFTTLNASGGQTYSWSPFAGISNPFIADPFASPTVTTTYAVTVSNPPCSSTDTLVVTVDPLPVITVSSDTMICNGTSIHLNAVGAVIYTWSPATGLNNPDINNPVASPAVTITYIVSGSDADGCSSSATLTLSVVQPPSANAGTDVQICFGESTQLNASGGISYLWLPSVGLNDSTVSNPLANPGSTTIYTVFVSDGAVCPLAADTVTVTVHPLPYIKAWPDTTIVAGSSITLNVVGSGINYLWYPSTGLTCNTCLSPAATPLQSTSYIVTTIDTNGCRNADTVVVNVDNEITLFLPDAFTPGNPTSQNPILYAYGIGIEEFEFYIYNRWGEQLFVSRDLHSGWDGTFKGSPVKGDVYLYVVKATSVTGRTITKTGTVTVLK